MRKIQPITEMAEAMSEQVANGNAQEGDRAGNCNTDGRNDTQQQGQSPQKNRLLQQYVQCVLVMIQKHTNNLFS